MKQATGISLGCQRAIYDLSHTATALKFDIMMYWRRIAHSFSNTSRPLAIIIINHMTAVSIREQASPTIHFDHLDRACILYGGEVGHLHRHSALAAGMGSVIRPGWGCIMVSLQFTGCFRFLRHCDKPKQQEKLQAVDYDGWSCKTLHVRMNRWLLSLREVTEIIINAFVPALW